MSFGMSDEWHDIPGYPGYQITRSGRVRNTSHRQGVRRGQDLKHHIDPLGYRCLHFVVDGRQRKLRLHRLLLLTFVGPPAAGQTHTRHLDGDPANNDLSNLAWGTPKENAADVDVHGRRARTYSRQFTDEEVREIRAAYALGRNMTQFCRERGWPYSATYLAARRHSYQHVL